MYRVRKSRKYKELCVRIKRNILDTQDLRQFAVFFFLVPSNQPSVSKKRLQLEFGLVALKTRDLKSGKTLVEFAVDCKRSNLAELISDFQTQDQSLFVYRKKDVDVHF